MRRFVLNRKKDISGVSGIGIVAEGVEFHDGQVALSWFGNHHTVTIAPSIKTVMEIHGHQGSTILEWVTDATAPPTSR